MTANFDSLVQVALLGTERQPPPTRSAPIPIRRSRSCSSKRYRRTANKPFCHSPRLPAFTNGSAHCRRMTRVLLLQLRRPKAPASDHASAFLQRLLKGDFSSIATDSSANRFKTAMQPTNVPPALLPLLLDAASNKPELRTLLPSTVGERGPWLAKQNSNWNYLPARALPMRRSGRPVNFLNASRSSSNFGASTRIAPANWSYPPGRRNRPRNRCFIQTFADGLAPADEEFLTEALADKRKEVRATAAMLLARISDSKYLARLIARAKP